MINIPVQLCIYIYINTYIYIYSSVYNVYPVLNDVLRGIPGVLMGLCIVEGLLAMFEWVLDICVFMHIYK